MLFLNAFAFIIANAFIEEKRKSIYYNPSKRTQWDALFYRKYTMLLLEGKRKRTYKRFPTSVLS